MIIFIYYGINWAGVHHLKRLIKLYLLQARYICCW